MMNLTRFVRVKVQSELRKNMVILPKFTPRVLMSLPKTVCLCNNKRRKRWMKYVQLIQVNHEYGRSLLRETYMTIFLTFQIQHYVHPNYSTWAVKYHNTLEETHPEIFREYQIGMCSINKTTKLFSEHFIDLSLKQTVNANAASQRTGIASMTSSISARQRWLNLIF